MGVIGVRSMTVRSALNSMSELAGLHPEVPHYRNDLAKCHFDRAGILNRTGRRDEALRAYLAAADLRRQLVRDNPEQVWYRSDLGLTLANVALVLGNMGRRDDALAAIRES